ncbi:DUF4430 domain-containing protein [Bdellovibrio sp. HCB209]|uniref:DUF4430 domain-containing protein n=1 Tax=Bdellovibrio sp. HCB209 TaxID=3394354 RepID=UPI0039B447F5
MKNMLALLFILAPLSANAITWKVIGACSETPLYQGTATADLKQSVGHNTIQIFDTNNVHYYGVAEGISSINDTPVGLDAVEVVSDTLMRAYGWCFTVNGEIPLAMPHKVSFKSQNDELVWFYGYSTNDKNQWIDMCVPGTNIKPDQFCKK